MASNTNGGVPSSFESAISEIDSLVQSLETGKLPLDQALAGYERGAELIRYCQKTLTSAEQKIQILESGLLQNYVPSKTSEDADEDE